MLFLQGSTTNTCSGTLYECSSTSVGSSSAVQHSNSSSRQLMGCCQLAVREGCGQQPGFTTLNLQEASEEREQPAATKPKPTQPQIPAEMQVVCSTGVRVIAWIHQERWQSHWECAKKRPYQVIYHEGNSPLKKDKFQHLQSSWKPTRIQQHNCGYRAEGEQLSCQLTLYIQKRLNYENNEAGN